MTISYSVVSYCGKHVMCCYLVGCFGFFFNLDFVIKCLPGQCLLFGMKIVFVSEIQDCEYSSYLHKQQ